MTSLTRSRGSLPLRLGLLRASGTAIRLLAIGRATPISRDRRKTPIEMHWNSLETWLTFCLGAGVPVLILVGYTGLGAGIRGGKGVKLELCHPRYLDELAIRFPDLNIIAARSAWPWQEEMIAVLLHKPNIWYELHGWSPKYLTESLKREISRRLQDRIMFGADYPLFQYERLVADWESLGYSREVLEKVFYKNAESFFARLNSHKG